MPRTQYKRTYILVHQSLSNQGYYAIADKHGMTVGPSADDAGLGNLSEKLVIVVNPNLWGGDTALRGFLDQYYPGVTYTSVVVDNPLQLDSFLSGSVSPTTLQAPYLSQLGTTASYALGDCGSTDSAMWINFRGGNVTVDDVSKATGYPQGFLVLSAADIVNVSAKFGLPLSHVVKQSIDILKQNINAGNPIITLVNYAALPARVKHDPNYTRGHWVLVVGYDSSNIIFHDPYEIDSAHGAFKTITQQEFDTAWSTPNSDFSTPRQMLKIVAPVISGFSYRGVGVGHSGTLTSSEKSTLAIPKTINAVKLLTDGDYNTNIQNINAVRSIAPSAFIMARMFFSVNPPSKFTPSQFVDYCHIGMDALYSSGVRHFEIHNEPNLPSEGMGFNWNTGAEFSDWLLGVLAIVKLKYPDSKWGFPGLSPQDNLPQFLSDAHAAISACDWVGAHCYWNDNQYPMLSVSGGLNFRNVRNKALGKPLLITEFSNNSSAVSGTTKGQEYASYFAALQYETDVVGAFSFALSWPGQDVNREGWTENQDIAKQL